jgi:hypothetical protein
MFSNKNKLLCSNKLLWKQKNLIKYSIWSIALYESETWTLGENEEGFVNAFETLCWRRKLKKWTE